MQPESPAQPDDRKLEVRRFVPALAAEWDSFVADSDNGTFLHSRAFFDANPSNAQDDFSLCFYRGSRLVALLPATRQSDLHGIVVSSHSRSTYGGIIFKASEIGVRDALSITASLQDFLRLHSVRRAVIRAPFRIIPERINDIFEYAMWRFGYTVSQRQVEFYLPLINTDNRSYSATRRRFVRGAYRDTVVAEESLSHVSEYWEILEANLMQYHQRRPVHDLDAIHKLIDRCGHDKFRLFSSRVDGKIVAGVLVFLPRPTFAHAQYIAQSEQGRSANATSGVIDCVAQWARSAGVRYLNLGSANEGGLVLNEGLADFKESFGAVAVLREDHEWCNSDCVNEE
jgi:hypothetical protein